MKTVNEVSKDTGVSIRALRYYDEIGLLKPTERSDAGYRLYGEQDLKKLRAILFLRELDVPLEDIKHALDSRDDYGSVITEYREKLVGRIKRLHGLLGVIDGMDHMGKELSFEMFDVSDANLVSEIILKSGGKDNVDEGEVSAVRNMVQNNLVDGKIGNFILQAYGSKEKYLSAVTEIAANPSRSMQLNDEMKEIYFAFNGVDAASEEGQKLVAKLEENTKRRYRTENARYVLLKIAEDYLSKGINSKVLDQLYGDGVTDVIGRAINIYYGI